MIIESVLREMGEDVVDGIRTKIIKEIDKLKDQ